MENEDVELSVDEMYNAEESVLHLSKALKISEADAIQLIEDGGNLNGMNKNHRFNFMIEELRATFDAY